MRNQLVLCWSGSPSAFGYRMGWLRALLGQKLRSLSRSFAALFILFVRFGYPNLARGVLTETRSHYARQQSNPSARMQKHRYHGDESKFAGGQQTARKAIVHIHNSQNQWIPPSVNRQRIHRRSIFKSGTAGAYSPSSSRRSPQSNVTLIKDVLGVHFCGYKAAN